MSVNVGVFRLKTVTATIECKKESNSGTLIGGEPGTDQATITFKECSVEGKTVAECGATSINPGPKGGNAGEIETTVKTVLLYPEGKKESTTEANDAFFPEGKGNLFVEFELKGTNCGTLNNKKVKVTATGTEVATEPAFKRKCGVIAEVGKVAGGVFARTESTKEFVEGALNVPGTITEGELWKPGLTGWEKIKCKLEAFSEEAKEVGLTKVETWLEPEEFGWRI